MTNTEYLSRLDPQILVDMALRGELGPDKVWVAMKAAAKYLKAIATGDVAPESEAVKRAGICAICTSCQWESVSSLADTERGWCGVPFKETDTTCGCFVALSVHGELNVGAKVCVASEQCPQDKWLACERA